MKWKLFSPREGFTLVEIAVSIALLGLVAASILSLLGGSYLSLYTGGRRSQAAALAQAKMEELRALSFEELLEEGKRINPGFTCPGRACTGRQEVPDFPGFSLRYALECKTLEQAGFSLEGLIVEVEVCYGEEKRSVFLTSFVRRGKKTF